jgi:hypothetical protein
LKNFVEAKKYYKKFVDMSSGKQDEYVTYARKRLKEKW